MDTFQITKGEDVYTSDGDKFGSVTEVRSNVAVVKRGFFPTLYYVPFGAFAGSDENGAVLNVGKDEALDQGWDNAPKEVASTAGYRRTDADDTLVAGSVETDATATSYRETGDEFVVPVREEELLATTTPRQAGNVEITTDVITEERTLEVPVTDERVRVERHVFQQPVDADVGADAFQRKVIAVPLTTEEVHLQTQTRVMGEVAVKKEQFERTQTVTGTVRREEVTVDEHAADLTVVSEPVAAAQASSPRRGGERASRSAKQKRRH